MDGDRIVREKIRAELAPEVFARQPCRSLLLIPLLAAIIGGSIAVVLLPLPWYGLVLVSVLMGNCHASMMFLGHEIAHGATVRARWLQDALLYPCCTIFCLSPHLWRIWHHRSHHAHPNVPGKDPDNFGTLEEFYRDTPLVRFFTKLAPGSGHLLSAIYLFVFFTIHAQSVLWTKSKNMLGYEGLDRKRAAVDSALMAALWIYVAVSTGIQGTIFIIVVPMLVANFVILSYVATNHMLRPLSNQIDTLRTTMSVTTSRLLDHVHLHFSHHVEHHLFPSMPGSMLPRVRLCLTRHFGDRYLAPPHLRALGVLFRTPRVYDGLDTLIDPYTGQRKPIARIVGVLKSRQELGDT